MRKQAYKALHHYVDKTAHSYISCTECTRNTNALIFVFSLSFASTFILYKITVYKMPCVTIFDTL